MIRSAFAALLALPVLASCNTMPEPCTSEWFDWKTERILGSFAYEHRDEIGRLRDVAPTLLEAGGGPDRLAPTAVLVLTAVGALQLAVDFAQDAWPEVQSAVSECAAPPQAARLFGDMLRREGVDERAVRAIEDLGVMVDSLGRGR
jgi:hypothetical protein